ncbi:hypothetical protein IMG5_151900, partial [Ichthyophthirius multifiliis]
LKSSIRIYRILNLIHIYYMFKLIFCSIIKFNEKELYDKNMLLGRPHKIIQVIQNQFTHQLLQIFITMHRQILWETKQSFADILFQFQSHLQLLDYITILSYLISIREILIFSISYQTQVPNLVSQRLIQSRKILLLDVIVFHQVNFLPMQLIQEFKLLCFFYLQIQINQFQFFLLFIVVLAIQYGLEQIFLLLQQKMVGQQWVCIIRVIILFLF